MCAGRTELEQMHHNPVPSKIMSVHTEGSNFRSGVPRSCGLERPGVIYIFIVLLQSQMNKSKALLMAFYRFLNKSLL